MKILFPSLPDDLANVDLDFAGEWEAAGAAGFERLLFDHGLVERGEVERALRRVPLADGGAIWHRSWMMTGEQYQSLHDALCAKGYEPCVTPASYEQSHYLPNAYPLIEPHTARSVWNSSDSLADAWQLYQSMSGKDALIKDWVKSAKYQWRDGCFLPAASSEARFAEIFRVFREERGTLFNRGVVFREYLPFRTSGHDMRGFPRIEEARLFFAWGQVLIEPNCPDIRREMDRWTNIAREFQTPFLSLDIASLEDGTYRIVEVGDGGVSGLPASVDPERFYRNLHSQLKLR